MIARLKRLFGVHEHEWAYRVNVNHRTQEHTEVRHCPKCGLIQKREYLGVRPPCYDVKWVTVNPGGLR